METNQTKKALLDHPSAHALRALDKKIVDLFAKDGNIQGPVVLTEEEKVAIMWVATILDGGNVNLKVVKRRAG